MLVFWNKSIHVCSCRVFLALQQLAPNPPARQLTREEEESWPESLRKTEIMDFRGGSPSLDLQFHLSWQDLKSCKYHASKLNLPGETQIIFFSLGMKDFLTTCSIFILLQTSFRDVLSIFYFFQIFITAFHTWNNHYSTWVCLKSHFIFRCRKTE